MKVVNKSNGKLSNKLSFIISLCFLVAVIVISNNIDVSNSVLWIFVLLGAVLLGLLMTLFYLLRWMLEYSWFRKVARTTRRNLTKINLLIIFLVLSICFGFYYFGLRVSNIKQECSKIASHNARGSGSFSSGTYTQNKNLNYMTIYEACKAQKGL